MQEGGQLRYLNLELFSFASSYIYIYMCSESRGSLWEHLRVPPYVGAFNSFQLKCGREAKLWYIRVNSNVTPLALCEAHMQK